MTVARWLETDSLSNQNIASAAAIGAYTADADRMIVCDVSIDAVAGNGDYIVYLTRQINGAGSAYVMLPKTTCTAASGETAIAMQSGPVTVRSGDVVTVYIDGLPGDTTTPDTVVRWFEMATLRPATADRSLTVAATGEASANVTLWAGATPDNLADGKVAAIVSTAVDVNPVSLIGVIETVAKARGTIAVSSSWQQDVITSGTALNNTNSSYTRSLDNQPWSIGESQNIDVYASFVVPTGTAAQAVVVRANVSLGSGTYVYISTDAETWINIEQLSYAMEQGEVKTIVVPSTVPAAGEDMRFLVRFNAGHYQNLQLDIDYCVLICNAPTATINQQDIADALLLAPAGVAAAGSAMDYLADTPANVWAYPTRTLTQSSTSTTDSTAAGSIARRRGDSWSISLTVGAITGYTSLWFTAKWDRDNTDAQAVLQIKLNASGLNDGLLYVNGAAATDDTLASITVSDASTGAIVIAVDETVTDDLPPAGIYYDVQALVSGTVSTLDSGTLTISADVTRAVA